MWCTGTPSDVSAASAPGGIVLPVAGTGNRNRSRGEVPGVAYRGPRARLTVGPHGAHAGSNPALSARRPLHGLPGEGRGEAGRGRGPRTVRSLSPLPRLRVMRAVRPRPGTRRAGRPRGRRGRDAPRTGCR
ncbi:hypothetical protein SGPA1_21503 [Streptomyces misionensis JCM 4497]